MHDDAATCDRLVASAAARPMSAPALTQTGRPPPRRAADLRAQLAGRRGVDAAGRRRGRRRRSCRAELVREPIDGLPGGERAGGAAPLPAPVAVELRHRDDLLPARLVHDEVQPDRQRGGGAPAGLRRRCTRWCRTTARRARLSCAGSCRSMLAEISGMDAVSLQPAAGAHGELTGMKMIRAYHARSRRRAHARCSSRRARTAPTRRARRCAATGRAASRATSVGLIEADGGAPRHGPTTSRR